MKRARHLFDQAFTRENLYAAYLDARKGKRSKRDCFDFERDLGANLYSLYMEIHNGIYEPRPYFEFIVHEPKHRLIRAPAFRDIVVQHAIYRLIYPIFDRCFISTSFACRKGYGTHRASAYLQKAMRQYDRDLYTLKLDVRKFFYSIDRTILQQLIERKIDDCCFVDLMMLFADMREPVGIPIGNLLSQMYALIYLNPLDHFIKRELKIKHYVRYVDDLVLIGLTRQQCLECRDAIAGFIDKNLRLKFSKVTIQKIRRGVNFVGYRTWQTKRFIRKYSLHKFLKKVKAGKLASIVSLIGHAAKTNSLPHMFRMMKDINMGLLQSLPKSIRRIAI
jgi:RNA-directed DNA polymerase